MNFCRKIWVIYSIVPLPSLSIISHYLNSVLVSSRFRWDNKLRQFSPQESFYYSIEHTQNKFTKGSSFLPSLFSTSRCRTYSDFPDPTVFSLHCVQPVTIFFIPNKLPIIFSFVRDPTVFLQPQVSATLKRLAYAYVIEILLPSKKRCVSHSLSSMGRSFNFLPISSWAGR